MIQGWMAQGARKRRGLWAIALGEAARVRFTERRQHVPKMQLGDPAAVPGACTASGCFSGPEEGARSGST